MGMDRLYTFTYADDMVLLAEEEGKIKCMIAISERYIDRKGLELNVDKSKKIQEGWGREKKICWM